MTKNCIENKKIFDGYDRKYSVFSDMTFLNQSIHIEGNQFFKKMDKDYPGSFFIYNYRDKDAWVESRLNHGVNSKNMSFIDRCKEIYGENTDLIIERWKNNRSSFEKTLFDYFKDTKQLLKLKIEQNDINQADLISDFLGVKLNGDYWIWLGKTNEPTKRKSILKKLSNNFKHVIGILILIICLSALVLAHYQV
jgi:hypothetical protein